MRWLRISLQTLGSGRASRGLLLLAVAVAWTVAQGSASATVVTDAFVEAIAQIESSGGRHLVGDGGRANGRWQMHAAAWQDTTAFRQRQRLPVWPYTHAHTAKIARLYARDYLKLLENQLTAALGRQVTAELVYAAYNVGFSRLQSRNFLIERTPASTQRACARLPRLMAVAASPGKQTLAMAKAR